MCCWMRVIFSLLFLVSFLIYVITMPFDCSFLSFCFFTALLYSNKKINISRQLTNEIHLTTGNCKIIDWLINEVGIM